MEFEQIIKQRRSVREFDSSKKLSDAQIKKLIGIAIESPSSFNLQPWEFIIVKEEERKKRLMECCRNQEHVLQASVNFIVLGRMDVSDNADAVLADREKKAPMDPGRKERFLKRIEVLKNNRAEAALWTTKSVSLACMALMLAAKNMGLDSCPMEGFDSAMVRKEFNIPNDREIVMVIPVGYAVKNPKRPMRFDFEKVTYNEFFGKK